MNSTEPGFLWQLLQNWASHAPLLIACVGGVVVVLMKWGTAPRASLLALLGILLTLVLALALPAVYGWLPGVIARDAGEQGENVGSRIQSAFIIVNVFASLGHAIAFALLFSAVYAGRQRP